MAVHIANIPDEEISQEWGTDLNMAITLYLALIQSLSPADKIRLIAVTRYIGHLTLVCEDLL